MKERVSAKDTGSTSTFCGSVFVNLRFDRFAGASTGSAGVLARLLKGRARVLCAAWRETAKRAPRVNGTLLRAGTPALPTRATPFHLKRTPVADPGYQPITPEPSADGSGTRPNHKVTSLIYASRNRVKGLYGGGMRRRG